jgi:hypothetical protein
MTVGLLMLRVWRGPVDVQGIVGLSSSSGFGLVQAAAEQLGIIAARTVAAAADGE